MISPRTRADAPYILVMAAVVLIFTLVACRYSRADSALPGGITCEQVIEYSRMLQIPNTRWGRAQARVVALALGVRLTTAQLDAASRCIVEFQERQ